jgi:hypothetical protein
MSIESFEKQTWEEWPVYGSILNVQNETETVVLGSSSVSAMDKDGNNVSSTFLDQGSKALGDDPDGAYTDNMLGMKCRDGEISKSPYYITFYMVTSEGNKYEVDVKVKIKRIPSTPIPVTTTTTTTTTTT